MHRSLILFAFLFATAAHAATFIVPSDEALVTTSPAIVVATAGESHSRWSAAGRIETVTVMHIAETIKGTPRGSIEVVAPGGFVDGVGLAIAGSPRYAAGERVLLMLDKDARGAWTARDLVVGVFRLEQQLALRKEVCGWSVDGKAHVEPRRAAGAFLDFVRATARGERSTIDYIARDARRFVPATEAATAASYLMQQSAAGGTFGIRWNRFPSGVTFLSNGSQPNAAGGGLTSVQLGIAAWTNDASSNIVYGYGGTTTRNSAFIAGDGVHSIQFNDPSNEIPGAFNPALGGTLAVGGAWFGNSTHTFAGERFYTILEADLVIQNGLPLPGVAGLGFDHVVTHELGHTLGLRHSDEPPFGGTQSFTAIMASSVDFDADTQGSNLQSWDLEAISAVYGAGPQCAAPAITAQPQSVSLARSEPVTLSVTATGDAPLTYQWYIGSRGDTRNPLSTGAVISVQPATTTNYWVRVSNGCGTPADSETASITVAGCPAVRIDAQTFDSTIVEGATIPLTVAASGGAITIQWYRGSSGDRSTPTGTGAAIEVKPATTTSYWAYITNPCGANASTQTITITVLPCFTPRILVQPAGGDVVTGESATLAATLTGTAPLTLQWYQGAAGDISQPIGLGNTVSTPPLFAASTFWLRATNLCGFADSEPVQVRVVPNCVAPVISAQPEDTAVVPGTTTMLSVGATGTSLVYRWYEGPVFDFTRPVGTSSPILLTAPISATTQFWVRVENGCGSISSEAAEVTPASGRRRSARR
ncbi:MAG TPA: M57 family metalloprotease [Thermoanaerobaculia bacterium]